MHGIDYRQSSGVILGLLLLAAQARSDEQRIPVDQLPKAVVDAVKAKFPDAKLTGAEKETNGDKVFYEVEFQTKGKSAEMLLTPEGKVVSIEKVIEAKELPRAVAAAVEARFPKATVKKAEEETKQDAVKYQVVLETADKKTAALVLDPAGKVLAQQKEIAPKELPKVVADSVEGKFPRATVEKAIESIREDKVTYYVRLTTADKKAFQLVVDAGGKIMREAEIKNKK